MYKALMSKIKIFRNLFLSSIKKNRGVNNSLIILDENNKRVKSRYIKNLIVNFYGSNNTIKVYSNLKITQRTIINCSNDNYVEIAKTDYKINFEIPHKLSKGASLIIGKNTSIFGAVFILHKEPGLKVVIGEDCMIARNVIIQPTDSHTIIDKSGKVVNYPADICIKNHVWIGRNSCVLKGSVIPENSVLAAGAIYTKSVNKYAKSNVIFAGCPAKIIKSDINWTRENTYDYDNSIRSNR